MVHIALEQRRPKFLNTTLRRYDLLLVGAIVALAFCGDLALFSATRVTDIRAGISPYYYLEHQVLYDVLGIIGMLGVIWVGYERLLRFGYLLYWIMMLALVGVMVVGHSSLGSQRWFSVGPFQLQPSAFAGLTLVITLATAAGRRDGRLALRNVLGLVVMAVVPILLVIKQPDLGSALIMLMASAAALVAAGVKGRHLAGLAVAGVLAVMVALSLHLLHAYQLARLTTFLSQNNPATFRTTTYNIQQSKFAISSGGFLGKGIFSGTQVNGGYVPAFSTDFIFSALGAQFGFLGGLAVILLFALIEWRVWKVAATARSLGARVCATGVLAIIGFSVFENVGMAMGIMPVAGIPLPLISFGGSAVLDTFAAVGLVLSIGAERSA